MIDHIHTLPGAGATGEGRAKGNGTINVESRSAYLVRRVEGACSSKSAAGQAGKGGSGLHVELRGEILLQLTAHNGCGDPKLW
jgi:hypothetical protein